MLAYCRLWRLLLNLTLAQMPSRCTDRESSGCGFSVTNLCILSTTNNYLIEPASSIACAHDRAGIPGCHKAQLQVGETNCSHSDPRPLKVVCAFELHQCAHKARASTIAQESRLLTSATMQPSAVFIVLLSSGVNLLVMCGSILVVYWLTV